VTQEPEPSADPVAWVETLSQRWLSELELREAPLVPVLDALFERARLQRMLYLAGPGVDVEQAADLSLDLGPLWVMLENQPDEVVPAVRSDLREAFSQCEDESGIGLPGGFPIVSGRPETISPARTVL
jgi:hypothetical protein